MSRLAAIRPGGGSQPDRGSRAQSEVTGTVLLIGVFAVVITVSGGLVLANYVGNATSDGPHVELDMTVNETHATVTHGGGGPLAVDQVTVVLRQDGNEFRSALSTWTLGGDDDGRFEPAERVTTTHRLDSGMVEIVVVHQPSGSLLLDERVRVQPGS